MRFVNPLSEVHPAIVLHLQGLPEIQRGDFWTQYVAFVASLRITVGIHKFGSILNSSGEEIARLPCLFRKGHVDANHIIPVRLFPTKTIMVLVVLALRPQESTEH